MNWRHEGKSKLPTREIGESTGGESSNSLSITRTVSDIQMLVLIYLPSGNGVLANNFSQTGQLKENMKKQILILVTLVVINETDIRI